MSSRLPLAVGLLGTIALIVALAATWPRWQDSSAPATASAPGASAARPTPPPPAPLPVTEASGAAREWAQLTDAERLALAPLRPQWNAFDAERRLKWLRIAERYQHMSPDAQARLHQRMTRWITLTPEQRQQVRANYQLARTVPPDTRVQAWRAYQHLPEKQRRRLAARQHRLPRSAVSAPPSPGGAPRHLPKGVLPPASVAAAAPGSGAAPGSAATPVSTPAPFGPIETPAPQSRP